MIVLLKLFVLFFVTFANKERYNNPSNRWENPTIQKSKYEDPILAYITRVNSNLEPIFSPFLGVIYNDPNSSKQETNSGSYQNAQKHLKTNVVIRRVVNEDENEKEMVFHCDFLTCPNRTHSCETTVEADLEFGIQLIITTQCLSITNEDLSNKTTTSDQDSSGMYYFESQTEDDEIEPVASDLDFDYSNKNTSKISIESEQYVNENESLEKSEEALLVPTESENIMLRRNADAIDEEIIFHCDRLACPSKTHSCKSTFIAIPHHFNEMNITTQCLSITNEVLIARSTTKNLSDKGYFFEINTINHELFDDKTELLEHHFNPANSAENENIVDRTVFSTDELSEDSAQLLDKETYDKPSFQENLAGDENFMDTKSFYSSGELSEDSVADGETHDEPSFQENLARDKNFMDTESFHSSNEIFQDSIEKYTDKSASQEAGLEDYSEESVESAEYDEPTNVQLNSFGKSTELSKCNGNPTVEYREYDVDHNKKNFEFADSYYGSAEYSYNYYDVNDNIFNEQFYPELKI